MQNEPRVVGVNAGPYDAPPCAPVSRQKSRRIFGLEITEGPEFF